MPGFWVAGAGFGDCADVANVQRTRPAIVSRARTAFCILPGAT